MAIPIPHTLIRMSLSSLIESTLSLLMSPFSNNSSA